MVIWLAQLIGGRRLVYGSMRAVLFVLRVVLLLLLVLAVGIVIWGAFSNNETFQPLCRWLIGISLTLSFVRAVWRRRGSWGGGRAHGGEEGPRTIDGKPVPDYPAIAALDVPASSPDTDAILRGLPDFGKAFLKLDLAEFEYVPEPEVKAPEPLKEKARPRSATAMPRWVIPTIAAAVVLVAGFGMFPDQIGRFLNPHSPGIISLPSNPSPTISPGSDVASVPTPAPEEKPEALQPAVSKSDMQAAPVKSPAPAALPEQAPPGDSTESPDDIVALKAAGARHLNYILANYEDGEQLSPEKKATLEDELQNALAKYQIAADDGDAESQFDVAIIEGGVVYPVPLNAHNQTTAREYLIKSANEGYGRAKLLMGVCYETGNMGFSANKAEAVEWYKNALASSSPGSVIHEKAEEYLDRVEGSSASSTNP